MAQRAATAPRGLLVVLAVAALAGFVLVAQIVFSHNATVYGVGPLAGLSGSQIDVLEWYQVILGCAIFAAATWRFGVVGALVAFAGYAIVGPLLADMSPLSDEPSVLSVRTECCDALRGWADGGAALGGVFFLFLVTPITLVARWMWRLLRPANP